MATKNSVKKASDTAMTWLEYSLFQLNKINLSCIYGNAESYHTLCSRFNLNLIAKSIISVLVSN